MHWILILTIWGYQASAIHSINFDTEEACWDAAHKWNESVGRSMKTAICVPQDIRNRKVK